MFRPTRRRVLASLGAISASVLLAGHTPYRQWAVLRQRFLLIHTNREDLGTDTLGERIAAVLAERLPSSRARVVRGPDNYRIGGLLSTEQADVAVLSRAVALALARREPPFAELPPTEVRVLAESARYQLVCRDSFPRHHGYLVAEALAADAAALGIVIPDRAGSTADPEGALPTHVGALAFLRGEPLEPPA
jgi:hypothetical protein